MSRDVENSFFFVTAKKISGLMQISLLNLVPEMQLANIYQRKRDMIRDRAVGSSEDPGGTIPIDNYLPIKLAKHNKFVTEVAMKK